MRIPSPQKGSSGNVKAYQKALWRTIGRSKGRFLAIFAIVALGAGFFAGLAQTAPQMRAAVDQYLDENRFLDIQISSTLGFSDNDVDAVKALSGVADAEGAYTSDILCRIADKDFAMRVHALPEEGDLNQILVKEGRLPEKADECVLDEQAMTLGDKGYALGIRLRSNRAATGSRKSPLRLWGLWKARCTSHSRWARRRSARGSSTPSCTYCPKRSIRKLTRPCTWRCRALLRSTRLRMPTTTRCSPLSMNSNRWPKSARQSAARKSSATRRKN